MLPAEAIRLGRMRSTDVGLEKGTVREECNSTWYGENSNRLDIDESVAPGSESSYTMSRLVAMLAV